MRVHRRRDQDRLVGCKQDCGGKIAGMAAGHPRHQIGRRWSDDDHVGIAGKPNMTDVEFALRIE
jgi:hypothetical protein